MPFDPAAISESGLIGDGPISSELRRRGFDTSQPVEAANASNPQLVADVIRAFVDAGAGLICTNTLSGNRLALVARGLDSQAEDINRSGVAIARGAADAARRPIVVAGQIGPSGRFLRLGESSDAELRDTFAEQAGWLARGGADVLLLARFLDLDELLIATTAAHDTKLPIIAALVFDSGADRVDTAAGQSPAQAAAALAAAGAGIVGCDSAGPETALTLIALLVEHSHRPIFVRTTAGSPELDEGRVVYPEPPAAFAVRAAELRRRGASIVAGCAGTTPDHTRALAAAWPAAAPRRPRR